MTLRRGFKSEANSYAREFRSELGLRTDAPLSPWSLAELLKVPVVPLSALRPFAPTAIAYLMSRGRSLFHAVTVGYGSHGTRRLILHNDASAKTRQASDVAHELSHVVLGHPLEIPFDSNGNRCYNRETEEEARWMGPALLVSDEAALSIVRRQLSIANAATTYGVSQDIIEMRLNVTGARRRAGFKPPRSGRRA